MKLTVLLLVIMQLLTGCAPNNDAMERAMSVRESLASASVCAFSCTVTADYGDDIYVFELSCSADAAGQMQFSVLQPDTISGITGTISAGNAAITFDGHVLAFPTLADGQLTPISGPWLFYNSLKSGYLSSCCLEDACVSLYIDDSYEENPIFLQVKLDQNDVPVNAEIYWMDRRVLLLEIENFSYR